MKIVIEVELGNDRMQTGGDVVKAISEFSTLPDDDVREPLLVGVHGVIRDINGNKVGEWKVER